MELLDQTNERDRLDRITRSVIGAAIVVHRILGPGLLESAYQSALRQGFMARGLLTKNQVPLRTVYKGLKLARAYRLDFVVDELVVVEIKALDRLLPLHRAQLLSYLKLSGCPVGLLVNFHVERLVDGVHRVVNRYPDGPFSLRP